MQKDFHYGVIKILSLYTGFSEEESEIIAYASQYVDDATLYRPFSVEGNIPVFYSRFSNKKFDPICTAHKGLQFLSDFRRAVQEKVYLSFHFLPPEPWRNQKNYSYRVRPGSEMAQILIFWAGAKLKAQWNTENLIRLGIALHTFADTWAHQNFSGTHNHFDNDIEHIEIWKDNHWVKIKPYKQLFYNFFPDIGHAEAYDFPDLPFLKWRYVRDRDKELIIRDNTAIFLKATEEIFKILCNIKNCNRSWLEIEEKLRNVFNIQRSSKNIFAPLRLYFPQIKLNYDAEAWLHQCFKFQRFRHFPKLRAVFQGDTKWILFHKVAYEQRLFVLDKIKLL